MFFAEGFYGHDDALYGAARLLRIVADSGTTRASELLADVPEFVSTPEIRVDCPDDLKFAHRRARRRALPRDARRHRRRRRARAVRRRLGPDPRVEHAAGARRALRGAHAGAPRRDPRRDGGWLRAAGRDASDVTTRRWLVSARWSPSALAPARSGRVSARAVRRLPLVRRARRARRSGARASSNATVLRAGSFARRRRCSRS